MKNKTNKVGKSRKLAFAELVCFLGDKSGFWETIKK